MSISRYASWTSLSLIFSILSSTHLWAVCTDPIKWANNPTTHTAFVGRSFDVNLEDFLELNGGGGLEYGPFPTTPPPAWLNIETNGQMHGTPTPGDVGQSSTIIVAKKGECVDSVPHVITVKVPPSWQSSNINLANATEDQIYSSDLKSFVNNPSGASLSYSLINSTNGGWFSFTDAVISGTPGQSDVGPVSLTVKFETTIDGTFFSEAADFSFSVVEVNDPPVWSPLTLTEATEDSAYNFDLSGFVTDEEGDALSFAKSSGPGWMAVAPNGSITGTPTFQSDVGTFDVSFTVSDGSNAPVPTTVSITVNNINDPPVWSAFSLADANEDAPYSFDISGFASDEDGDALSFAKVDGPDWLQAASNGQLSGTPLQVHVGDFTATFSVTDGNSAPVNIVVNGKVIDVDDRPVWANFSLPDATEDAPYSFDISGFASDEDGDALTFAKSSGPAWLSVSGSGAISGTPLQADVGDYSATFSVTDGNSAPVEITVDGKVLPADDRPVWTNFSLPDATEDSPYSFDISGFASDEDGDALTFAKVSGPGWLQADGAGVLSGTPLQADVGDYTATFSVTDGNSAPVEITVDGKVLPADDRPVWTNFSLPDATEDSPYSFDISGFASDEDGDALTFAKVSGPGWLQVNSAGALSGTPLQADVGDYTATFSVTDGNSAPVEITVDGKVLPADDRPVWTNFSLPDATEDSPYSFDISGFASDEDGDALTFAKVGGPSWLQANSAGVLSGTPLQADVGDYTATFSVTDGNSAPVEITVDGKVLPADDRPVWTNFSLPDATEDSPYSFDISGFASDEDGDALTFAKVSGPGWLQANGAGVLSGTPLQADVGDYTATFSVTDGNSAPVEITVDGKVLPADDRPVWTNFSLPDATEDSPYSFDISGFASDEDGDALTFAKVSGPGWLQADGAGVLSGTPLQADVGDYTATFSVTDGNSAPVEITVDGKVLPADDRPVWTNFSLPDATEDSPYSFDISGFASDEDGDALTFAKVGGPSWLQANSAGVLSGTPLQADVGDYTATFSVTDGNSAPVEITVDGKVLPADDRPVWTNFSLPDATEDSPYSFDISGFASDEDGDALTFAKVGGPSWLQANSAGVLSGTPLQADVGDYTATFSVTDGNSAPVEITVDGKVLPADDRPVWTNFSLPDAMEDSPYSFDISGFASDEDGDALTFAKVSGPGWLQANGAGVLSGTPLQADVGDYTATFSVTDGNSAPVEITVDGKVLPADDRPVWTNFSLPDATEDSPYSFDISGFASDEDGDALTFAKVSGPGWLQADGAGVLSGTPLQADVGDYTATFSVTDGNSAPVEITVDGKVLPADDRPVWTNFSLPDATEDSPYSFDISGFASDEDGDALTFAKVSGPSWLQVNSAGALSGTPLQADVGDYTATFSVTDGNSAPVEITVDGKVLPADDRPVWTNFSLPDATEDSPYSFDISGFASDEDGDALTFAKVSGPGWLQVNSAGALSGTPLQADVGDYTATFSVTDGNSAPVEITVDGKVLPADDRPVWTNFSLPDATEDSPYSFDISGFASDEDGDALTFAKVSGPGWLQANSAGVLSGTPLQADVGDYTATFSVTDGNSSPVEITVDGKVLPADDRPVWTNFSLPDATEDSPYSFDISGFASDEDGDALTFAKVSGPGWLQADGAGVLSGTPLQADVGDYTATFSVTDGNSAPVEITVDGKVLPADDRPVWTNFSLPDATEDSPYSFDISGFASDEDGDVLTFAKVGGPGWLQANGAGVLSGTPLQADVGDYTATFSVTDGNSAPVEITVDGKVLPADDRPVWTNFSLPDATEDSPYSFDISGFASDEDGDVLTFAKVNGPGWLQANGAGALSGTPLQADVGDYTATFSVTDGNSAPVEITVDGKVLPTDDRPVWTDFSLPDATEDSAYSFDISGFASDEDGDSLTFAKVSGPDWLQVSVSGALSGTPLQADVGDYSATFSVTDGNSDPVEITVDGKVLPADDHPVWTHFDLPDATEDTPFSFDISPFASDEDGDPLTFALVGGPDWLQADSQGVLSGTPRQSDVGDYLATFSVTDGNSAPVQIIVSGKVLNLNDPPVWSEFELPVAAVGRNYSFNVSPFATDEDGDVLTFNKVLGPSWLNVSSSGQLSGVPSASDKGEHSVTLSVSDGIAPPVEVVKTLKVEEINVDPRWIIDPIQLTALEGELMTENIAPYVVDDNGDVLTFTKLSGPAWANLSTEGVFTGTPAAADVGQGEYRVLADDGRGGTAEVTVFIRVNPANHAPYWVRDPIAELEAPTNQAFTHNVASLAVDPDGDPLTFSKVSGPNWLFVTSQGLLIGTPTLSDLGENEFEVKVEDPSGLSDTGVVKIVVTDSNTPPYWTSDAIPLGTAVVGEVYQFDLKDFVKDDEGDPLTFAKVNGPAWLIVNTDGTLTGTPQLADLGPFTARFSVTDGGLHGPVEVDGFGTVIEGNAGPVVGTIFYEIKERSSFNVNLVTDGKVSDPNNDPLTFSGLTPSVDWIKLSPNGDLQAVPKFEHIGEHEFSFEVSDSVNPSVPGVIRVRVIRDPRAPEWTTIPIRFTAYVDTPFSESIAEFARDLDNLPLQFFKKSGPNWLDVASDGQLTGTPKLSNLGNNFFVVEVRNDRLGAENQVIIDVKRKSVEDRFVLKDRVPGARAENVWVVDNTKDCSYLIYYLKKYIGTYFDILEQAGIRHTGIFLSSDVNRWDGQSITFHGAPLLMRWDFDNPVADFRCRVDAVYRKWYTQSPLWTLSRFYEQLPSYSFYKNDFMEESIPMDVLIVTKREDQYKHFAEGTGFEGDTPEDYAARFTQLHSDLNKPYRLNFLGPDCPKDPADGTYSDLTESTQGAFLDTCRTSVKTRLREYANQVVASATLFAQSEFQLSEAADPNSIRVFVAGTELQNDQWTYTAPDQTVKIFWNLVINKPQPGDEIEIQYSPVSRSLRIANN